MIEESATVVRVEGPVAWVRADRRSGCSACAGGGCGVGVLARVLGGRPTLLQVRNDVDARAGERVTLAVEERALVRAAGLLYGAPLAALVAGAVAGRWVGGVISIVPAELGSVVGGFLGLGVSLWWVRGHLAGTAARGPFQPRLTRRLGPEKAIYTETS